MLQKSKARFIGSEENAVVDSQCLGEEGVSYSSLIIVQDKTSSGKTLNTMQWLPCCKEVSPRLYKNSFRIFLFVMGNQIKSFKNYHKYEQLRKNENAVPNICHEKLSHLKTKIKLSSVCLREHHNL